MFKMLFICALSLQVSANAQNSIDLANTYWRTSPFNTSNSAIDNVNFDQFVIDAKLPIKLNENNFFILGMEYQENSIRLRSNVADLIVNEYRFASSTLQVGVDHTWKNGSKMLFIAFGRLNTDYQNISVNHFQLGGLALGTTKRSDQFEWRYGIYYNAEFFGPMIVPLFGFNWEINDKWRLKVLAPVNLEISYQPKTWFRSGLRFDGVNVSYRAAYLPGFLTSTYLDKVDNNIWLFSEVHLGKNIWFHVKAGHSIIRKYRFYDTNEKLALKLGPVNLGNNRPTTTSLFNNGWSFEGRFIYRLPFN